MAVSDRLRPTLLDIKNGRMPLTEVMDLARSMTPELQRARAASQWPAQADIARIDQLVVRIREDIARRHIRGESGPLGADAPPCPLARWPS